MLLITGVLLVAWQIFGGVVMGRYYDLAAEQAFRAGARERAAQLWEKKLAETPNDEELRLSLSALYIEIGNLSRAEYILQKGIAVTGPNMTLYTELCRVYVLQDKLQDAIALLDGIRSQTVLESLSERRPKPPQPQTPPGTYNERVALRFDIPEGAKLYLSIDGTVPSVENNRYTEPVTLPDGVTELRAVLVNESGLVSDWMSGSYLLENVVYPITFEDPAIEALIRAQIGKSDGELFTEDVWAVDTLADTEPASYTTLNDIRFLPALRSLSLVGTRGECDISALRSASALRELHLEAFGLQSSHLEAVSPLVDLESLSLPDNNIAMLDALSTLTGLQTLDVSRNSLTALEPLSALTDLRALNLAQNAVADTRPLSALTKVEDLRLSENNLLVLEGIQGMSALRVLDVSGNIFLGQLEEIRGLQYLETVLAARCSLTELPDCGKLTVLKAVSVEQNNLQSLAGLNAATALETLNASRNYISSVLPLTGKAKLQMLDLSENGITDITPLAELGALETVDLTSNAITTILPLQSCPSLKQIDALDNPLTDAFGAWDGRGVKVNGR